MKKVLVTLCAAFVCYFATGQDFNTMTGDWIRVRAEFANGDRVPANHHARTLVRYNFTKNQVYQLVGGNTVPTTYTRTGNDLRIGPVMVFSIEEYTDKVLTLVDSEIRHFLIPTDSFQVSGMIRYPFEIVNSDTIYKSMPGIEPIFPMGGNKFLSDIMSGFSTTVGFNFTYVVQKDGSIGDVIINASINPKTDKRLIQLVKKTSGKWIPATLNGHQISVRQSMSIGSSR